MQQFDKKVKSVELLYSNHIHGWKLKDWKNITNGKSHTLTLFRSQKGNVSAGYLHIKWEDGGSGNW